MKYTEEMILHSESGYCMPFEEPQGKEVEMTLGYGGSAKTSFILAGDNMGPAKLEKAKKLGPTILSEDEFLKLIS